MFITFLSLVFVLNLLDLYLTRKGVKEGYLVEMNPLMDKLLRNKKIIPFKVIIGLLFVVLLWLGRGTAVAQVGVRLVALVYLYVLGLHIYCIREHRKEERK